MRLQGYSNTCLLISLVCIIAAVSAQDTPTTDDTSVSTITAKDVEEEFCTLLKCIQKTKILGSLIMQAIEFQKLVYYLLPDVIETSYKNSLNLLMDTIIRTVVQIATWEEELLEPLKELNSFSL